MANWSTLKAAIANIIKTNGNQEITGQLLQNVLNNIVSSVGENSTFAGIATPATNPGVPDGPVFYFANEPGVYSNFSSIIISYYGIYILYNDMNNSWKSIKLYECLQGLGTSVQFPISQQAITNLLSNLQIEFIKRLQGTSEDSDALRDPLKWLGSVEDDGGLNTLLDGLHAKGESEGKAKAGFFRGDYEGSPFMVESIPINYTEDTWVQSVRGRFVPVYQGTVDKIKTLTRSNTEYNILWRVCEKGTWGTWNSMTDAPTIPDTDLSMGLKDGDETSGYMQMFTRKGGCYSVTGSMTGVVTGTMMVFCDSWGEHGIEQVLFTDASDIEGKIVHDISSSGHVDGEPRIYHRYYDIRQSGGKWGVWKSFTTGGGTTAPPYVAFDFGVLQEKIGSGRTQGDLDAFGLTEEVWAKIRGAEIMVVRDDAHERTYVVTGSSDDYISFAYGMSETYEGWEIKQSGNNYIIFRHQTQGGGGGESIIIE